MLDPAKDVFGNVVEGNQLGLNGTDLNGYDMFYDGAGSGNCFGANALTSPNIPADNSTFAACPGPDPNAYNADLDKMAADWVVDPVGAHWVRHDHAPKPGYNPLELWTPAFDPGSAVGGP